MFAFAKHFDPGKSKANLQSALFTIAHIQDPVARFARAKGCMPMRPLWIQKYSSVSDLLNFHYTDFANASALGQEYAAKVYTHARKVVSDNYADIVSLSARQVMGALTFSGNASDPLIFLKEISSSGNIQTVDVIAPAYPFFLYTNPDWLGYLLEPLLEHQSSGLYPNKCAMRPTAVKQRLTSGIATPFMTLVLISRMLRDIPMERTRRCRLRNVVICW